MSSNSASGLYVWYSLPAWDVDFYPNVTYVTFVFAITNPSVVCLFVSLVHLTQGLNLSAIFLHRCLPWPSSDLLAKFYGDDVPGESLYRKR